MNADRPKVTVAAVIEKNGQFLFVEEETRDGLKINQPAGHLESGESLVQGIIRETLEETAYDFKPTGVIGVYMSRYFSSRFQQYTTYCRFAFSGDIGQQHARSLDHGIRRTLWMTWEELFACASKHRTPDVLRCVDDYLRKPVLPLSFLHTNI